MSEDWRATGQRRATSQTGRERARKPSKYRIKRSRTLPKCHCISLKWSEAYICDGVRTGRGTQYHCRTIKGDGGRSDRSENRFGSRRRDWPPPSQGAPEREWCSLLFQSKARPIARRKSGLKERGNGEAEEEKEGKKDGWITRTEK